MTTTYKAQDVINSFSPRELADMVKNYTHTEVGDEALPTLEKAMEPPVPQKTI